MRSIRFWKGGAALIAAMVMLAIVAVPSARAQDDREISVDDLVVEASRQVDKDPDPTRLYVIPQIAVSPNDPNVLVATAPELRNGGCSLFVSRDAGLSWALANDQLLPAPYDHCMRRPLGPVVEPVFAPSGDALYIGMGGSTIADGHPNGPAASLVARTDDLGLTVATAVVAAPQEVETQTTMDDGEVIDEVAFEQLDHTSVAVDPSNEDIVYQAWRRQTTPPPSFSGFVRGVFSVDGLTTEIAKSPDGGVTWSEPFNLTRDSSGDLPAGSDIASTVVAADGTAYVFTKERAPGGGDGPPPSNRLFMFKSTDAGQSWTSSVINEGAPRIGSPEAAIDPETGALHLAYEFQGQTGGDPRTIRYIGSTDGGATWSDPIDLVEREFIATANQYSPGISVSANGRVDVAWFDFRNDPFFEFGFEGDNAAGERFGDIYYSFSEDGQTWSPNIRITDRLLDMANDPTFLSATRGPVGVASAPNSAMFIWPDSRAGDAQTGAIDAYFTRARLTPAGAATGSSGDSDDWAWSVLGGAIALAAVGAILTLIVIRGRDAPSTARATARS